MTNKKRYNLIYADGYQMTVEIDHEILTEDKLLEINSFWGGHEYRLRHDTPLDAVLKMFCATFMAESAEHFDPEQRFNSGEVEGWPPLNGSWGITLVTYEPFTFEPELVEIEER
jgi:hypothetical protein